MTGRSRRAATVALAALVGTQLGQTMLRGGADRTVLMAGLGSAAVLAAAIQTPGVSGFFGCTPLGPVGWGIAAGGATVGTLLGGVLARANLGPRTTREAQITLSQSVTFATSSVRPAAPGGRTA